jgi:hypothetical protein
MMDDKHIGSSLEDVLREEGRLEEARQVAAKKQGLNGHCLGNLRSDWRRKKPAESATLPA